MNDKPKRLIYPPIWMLAGLAAIFALDRFAPLASFEGTLPLALGGFAIFIGLVLSVHAGIMFKAADTDVVPFRNVSALVTTGVYRVTRNPMYLGLTLVLFGTALTVGAFSAMFVAPVFMVIVQFRFIRHEEAMLRGLFGEEYENYRKLVRRWL